jgi:hypothetical protein
MTSQIQGRVQFGLFEADLSSKTLSKRGIPIRIQEKPFQILQMLLERRGDLVTRDELRQQLWPVDTFVEFDEGVNTAIGKPRHALGDSAERPAFVETVRGKDTDSLLRYQMVTRRLSASRPLLRRTRLEKGRVVRNPGRGPLFLELPLASWQRLSRSWFCCQGAYVRRLRSLRKTQSWYRTSLIPRAIHCSTIPSAKL